MKHQRVIFTNVFGINGTRLYIFMFLNDLISRFKIPKSLYENLNIYVNNDNRKFSDSAMERRVTKLIHS